MVPTGVNLAVTPHKNHVALVTIQLCCQAIYPLYLMGDDDEGNS